MAAVTVKKLAEQIGVSSERLIQQLEAAGISSKNAEGDLDDKEKETLLAYLRGGNASTDSDLQRRITLKRRTTSAVRQTSRTGGARTVHVEVKKRRTYVKRGDLQRQQQVAREAAEADKAARLAAEEEAKAKVEAEKKAAEDKMGEFGYIEIHDVTSQWGVFAIAGPKSRDLLKAVINDKDTSSALSNKTFPWLRFL